MTWLMLAWDDRDGYLKVERFVAGEEVAQGLAVQYPDAIYFFIEVLPVVV